jgi:hypothetical protein
MALIFSAATAIVLLLLALKLSQRLTLRLRVLAGVSLSRPATRSCPHLGLGSDPFTHESSPSDDHRCYLWMQRDRIDLVHQKGFCLTTAHHKCPWLMMRRPDAPPPLRQRLPGLVRGFPRAAWSGLRTVPGAVAMAFARVRLPRPPKRERAVVREPLARTRAGLGRMGATLAVALSSQREKGSRQAARAGGAVSLAIHWAAAHLWQLLMAAARGLSWLLRTLARLARRSVVWAQAALTHRLEVQRQLALQRRVAAEEARLASAAAAAAAAEAPVARAATVQPEQAVAPSVPQPAPQPEPVVEPVLPPSLANLEALLADGVAALDRGEESLAYHMFAKATEQRIPRGAGEAYADVMKRAWFWRAKTSETLDDVVLSLERALQLEPGNLQMQAHLAWAKQRLERERKLLPVERSVPQPAAAPTLKPKATLWPSIGTAIRVLGALAALALAALWMTTGVMPALGSYLGRLPAGDELLLQRLILTLNATALPGGGHLPLPVVNYDLGLSLPFIMAFLFVFTARGLMDGDTWARSTGLLLAAGGGWLCAAAVANPDASRIGLALSIGVIVAAAIGRFESQHTAQPGAAAY